MSRRHVNRDGLRAGEHHLHSSGCGRVPTADAAVDSAVNAAPQTNDLDLPTGQRCRKEFDNAAVRCALLGCELRQVEVFVLSRHGDQRFFSNLQAVLAFIENSQELQ